MSEAPDIQSFFDLSRLDHGIDGLVGLLETLAARIALRSCRMQPEPEGENVIVYFTTERNYFFPAYTFHRNGMASRFAEGEWSEIGPWTEGVRWILSDLIGHEQELIAFSQESVSRLKEAIGAVRRQSANPTGTFPAISETSEPMLEAGC